MSHPPVTIDADPREVERAAATWHEFTKMAKISVIAIAILLALMATFLA
jgi:hypothetical protein